MLNKIKNSQQLLDDILREAKQKGASQAEAYFSNSRGYSVTARLGETETVEYNQDKSLSLTVYFGKCKGGASTTDTSWEAIKSALDYACDIAKVTSIDSCAGLADKELMAFDYPELDLYYPWELDTDHAIDLAKQCEAAGREYDKRLTNSEGATLNTHAGYGIYANSHGFNGSILSSRHSISCVLLASDGHAMHRDYDFTTARDFHDLASVKWVGEQAAKKTVNRLGARRIHTQQTPVIFISEIAGSLWRNLIQAISGGNLYRKSSFLLEQLDKQIFPKHIHIYEQPHLLKAIGSSPFDNEGVGTVEKDFVRDGILQSYVLSSYSARKLGMKTTGNAGGVHNLRIDATEGDLAAMLKKMGRGLLVTELMGQGVNIVTGDYSRGASGFWIENGEIQFPVEEITIAGNLAEMFKKIVGVGSDVEQRGNIQSGSVWIEQMMVSGE